MKRENIIKLQRSLDNLIEIHNQLILSNKFNEALNVMKNIEAITRQLREFDSPIVIESEENSHLDWYNVLKFFIETKQSQLIELDYSDKENEKKHRATGKTTALLRLSNDYNIPILIRYNDPNNIEHKLIKEKAEAMNLNVVCVDLKMLNLAQYKNYDVLLIDESTYFCLKHKLDSSILKNKVLVGFKPKY